ncbi:MAG TPA: tetratricopeptide repeat protein [Candidatus Polarisedimenticolaceae bacterium]|nr:tetratricopeptide repeat protein [Candidatus Polarisedimenticolaceae bacterium]
MRRAARLLRIGCACLALGTAAPAAADSPERIFERGNSAYDAGAYAEAADAYRTLLKYQILDPRLEYNLGNAEFRLGNLGRAILHYERARRLDPSDRDIQANLAFARSLRLDRVPPAERPAAVAWVVGIQDRLGPDPQAWTLVALLWLLGAVVAWGLAERGRWSGGLGWCSATLALLIGLTSMSWYATHTRVEGQTTAVVVDEATEVLAGPGQNNATLATIHEGLDVEVWGERNEWIQVRLPNGVSGWVAKRAIEIV